VMQVIKMPGEMWAFLSQHSGLDGKDINAAVASAFDQLTEKIARAAPASPRSRASSPRRCSA